MDLGILVRRLSVWAASSGKRGWGSGTVSGSTTGFGMGSGFGVGFKRALGFDCGRAAGFGFGAGACVYVGFGAGVYVGVGIGIGVGIGVGVGVGVGVQVGIGIGVGTTSITGGSGKYARSRSPMSSGLISSARRRIDVKYSALLVGNHSLRMRPRSVLKMAPRGTARSARNLEMEVLLLDRMGGGVRPAYLSCQTWECPPGGGQGHLGPAAADATTLHAFGL